MLALVALDWVYGNVRTLGKLFGFLEKYTKDCSNKIYIRIRNENS